MKKQVWVIDNFYVAEPGMGGLQLGELGNGYVIPADVEVIHFTQIEYDRMMDEFYKIHGHYPDQ